MKRPFYYVVIGMLIAVNTFAQIDAGLFRYPDVSQTHIVFTYANDLWVVSKEGGTAYKLSSPPGVETYPRFSPDGNTIAFSANYDGNRDVFVIPTLGGSTTRLTYHGMSDRVVDWYPDGQSILIASGRDSEKERFNKFFKLSVKGGLPEKLPLSYAEFGSLSPDGKKIALTFETQIGRTWKRYRGGNVGAIHIFNLTDNSSEKISATEADDEFPMWHENKIFFLSDRGAENRMNLWEYDVTSKAFKQLTKFTDNDVHYPSLGKDEIVFEQGGKMYLFNISAGNYKEVKISLVTDGITTKPKQVKVDDNIQHASISPDGKRVLLEARGEVFSLPAENGYIKNLSQTTGVAERYPSWSPDGKKIAYWSDRSGEYELTLLENGKERKLTSVGAGFRYNLFWSPDSKKLAFIDKAMKIQYFDITTNALTTIDKALRFAQGSLEGFTASWSPDSRWITYSRDLDNYHYAVYLYDTQNKKLNQITSGYYNTYSPVFDVEGKYIFVITDQQFNPSYSSIDNTFIYSNSNNIAAISLKKSTISLLYPKNDTVSVKEEKKAEANAKGSTKKDDKKKDDDKKDESEKVKPVDIDIDGLESRLVLLPIEAGNYNYLQTVKGKLLYQKYPNTGSGGHANALIYFDFDKRETKSILSDADFFIVSANGEKIVAGKGKAIAVIKPEEGQTLDKAIRVSEMEMTVDPKVEWKQILVDAWRLERDYFYDPNMHGVDWNKVKTQYSTMLEGVATREEVNFVIGEMIGELNASHTYRYGGDEENEKHTSVGYLGVDWQAEGQFYKIKRIVQGALWDAEIRSPLSLPGVPVKEGYYILAVNGIPLTTQTEPYAAFQGLGKKTVELTYNSKPTWDGSKTTIIETMDDEARLRHLEWIEKNRKRVDEATHGEAGYIYVRSTGIDGQNELIRQFNAQWDKKSLIIDERFNNGGQIPDRFIEMLNRPAIVSWAIRDGKSWPWPQYANYGPKVMLINGWSGSGGDAFPDYFRKAGLGPLIGTRTWGGLIGISGVPPLIDGGGVTVPTFRMYNLDGTWFKEGHGVDPDIAVPEDLTSMAKGVDPQLERAIQEIKERLKKGFTEPKIPAFEVR
ncbi:MAG TPA: PDZ domain-containing protein [Cyclobacteriaceae bacterium]